MKSRVFFIVAFLLASCAQEINFNTVNDINEFSHSLTDVDIVSDPTDIVFVIDSSNSMQEEVTALKNNIQNLADSLRNHPHVDYRIYTVSFWDNWFHNGIPRISSSKVDRFGHKNDLSNTINAFNEVSFLTNISPIENGIAVSGAALSRFYGSDKLDKTDERAPGAVEIVLISDEDNERVNPALVELGLVQTPYVERNLTAGATPVTYTYRFEYDSPRKRIEPKVACLRDPNEHSASPDRSAGRYYCEATDGEGRSTSVNYRYGAGAGMCDVPRYYYCMITEDGHTSEARYSYPRGTECRVDESDGTTRKVVRNYGTQSEPAFQLGATNCKVVSCEEQFYFPRITYSPRYNYSNPSLPLQSISIDGCRNGYKRVTTNRTLNAQARVLADTFVAPEGITIANTKMTGTLRLDRWVTDEEALELFRAEKGDEILGGLRYVSRYPSKQVELGSGEPIKATPDGFVQLVNEVYPGLQVGFNAIIAPADGACAEGQQANNQEGIRYRELAEKTGGFVGDICNLDFAPLMQRLADHTSVKSLPRYRLQGWVNPDAKFEVRIGGRILVQDVDYEILPDGLHIKFKEGVLRTREPIQVSQRSLRTIKNLGQRELMDENSAQ